MKMDPKKIQSIRDYLLKHFPSDNHDDQFDFDRDGQKFRIKTKDCIYLALVSREFVEDNESNTILSRLNKYDVRNILQSNPSALVIITNSGVRLESVYWDRVKKSLENSRYKWRTPRGVAKEIEITEKEVKKAFTIHSDVVIKSSIPADTGEELYTTREHFRELQSPFVKLTSSLFTRVSSSSTGSSNED